MKTIGLIGGMSWESTAHYYSGLNQGVKKRLGGLHSAKIVLHSVDFAEIEALMCVGSWDAIAMRIGLAARTMQTAGADFILICTNTIHKVAPQVQKAISIPLLHIADATADHITNAGLTRVGLLGTRFTMEHDFYSGRLRDLHGIETLTPPEADRGVVDRIIFDELCLGTVNEESRQHYVRIIEDLQQRGAQAVVLGCTEIAMLVTPQDTDIPLLDTTRIHVDAALEMALPSPQ